MKIKVEFSGGLELLFQNQKAVALEIEDSSSLQNVIDHLK